VQFSEFSRISRTRCESPTGFNHQLDSWSLSDWMTAILGELGEAANIVKKLNRIRDGIPGNNKSQDELLSDLKDELADTFIYLDLVVQSQGFNLEEIVRDKFNRTSRKLGCNIEA
jgi:NTP pyrophosphatase (non-canonical NTP hydrolase)